MMTTTAFNLLNSCCWPQLNAERRAILRSFFEPGMEKTLGDLHVTQRPLIYHRLCAEGLLGQKDAPKTSELAADYFRRQRPFRALMSALKEAGLPRVVLLKGAALAPLYDAPAVRNMCDFDLLVSDDELMLVEEVCLSLGWHRIHPRDATYRNDQGVTVDWHSPANELGKQLLASAETHPTLNDPFLHWPKPESHLVFLSLHCFAHHGEKIWKDVTDARCLLPLIDRGVLLAELKTLPRVAQLNALSFLAFLEMANKKAGARDCPALLTPPLRTNEAVSRRVEFLETMSRESASPATLHLFSRLRRPPLEFLTLGLKWFRKKSPTPGIGTTIESSPYLATMTPQERLLFCIKTVAGLTLRGKLFHRLKVAKDQAPTYSGGLSLFDHESKVPQ